jgi:hypothetical protein
MSKKLAVDSKEKRTEGREDIQGGGVLRKEGRILRKGKGYEGRG